MKQLEIEQDIILQRKLWRFQKKGMWVLLVLFFAAVLGLLGSGPLSKSTSENDYLKIEYPYFSRYSLPEDIVLTIKNSKDDTVKIIVSRDFLESISLEKIIPEPVSESFYKNFVEYSFASAKTKELRILFNMNFRKNGQLTGLWGLKETNILQSNHFIYP